MWARRLPLIKGNRKTKPRLFRLPGEVGTGDSGREVQLCVVPKKGPRVKRARVAPAGRGHERSGRFWYGKCYGVGIQMGAMRYGRPFREHKLGAGW